MAVPIQSLQNPIAFGEGEILPDLVLVEFALGDILGRVDPLIYFRIKSPHLTRDWRIVIFDANRAAPPDQLFRAALRLIESV